MKTEVCLHALISSDEKMKKMDSELFLCPILTYSYEIIGNHESFPLQCFQIERKMCTFFPLQQVSMKFTCLFSNAVFSLCCVIQICRC